MEKRNSQANSNKKGVSQATVDHESQLIEVLAELEQYRTALRLANNEIEQRNRNTITLTTFAYRASRAKNLAGLLKLVLKQALETTHSEVGAVVLAEPDGGALTLGYHQGVTPKLIGILTGEDLGNGAIALMPHLVSGTGALLEYKTSQDPLERQLLKAGRVSSLASFPLVVNQTVMGALLVGLRGKRSFKSSELSFLMAISQATAQATETLSIRERLWRTVETFLEERFKLDLDLTAEKSLNMLSPEYSISIPSLSDLEDKLQRENMDLQVLMTLAESVNRSLDMSDILQSSVDQTKAILNTDAAWLYMVEEDEEEKLRMFSHAGLSRNYVQGMRRLTFNDEVEGEVVRTNKPLFVASITNRPHKIWVDKEGLRALAAVPITRRYAAKDGSAPTWHVMGVLAAGIRGDSAYEWSVHEMDLLIAIANQVASAVEKAQSFANIQENETSLKGSNEILRGINDMLIQKNASFERFIHQELKPSLKKISQSFQHLNPAELTTSQKQQLMTLQKVVDEITNSTQHILDN
ncbi:GAF domain-containing protein [Anaerolineales bacterium HSG25]|nr:GAF domain-containing protein [Anaerolineales bacterium HSG25]